MLERTNVPRQRVARHLEKVYGSPDFRSWEGRLMRYCAGLVPKPHEVEAIVRAVVQPREAIPAVMHWLHEGGPEPEFTVTFDPVSAPPPTPPGPPQPAEPLPSDPLNGVLLAFKADRLTLAEARAMLVMLRKSGMIFGSPGTSSSSCSSTSTPRSFKAGVVMRFPSTEPLKGEDAI